MRLYLTQRRFVNEFIALLVPITQSGEVITSLSDDSIMIISMFTANYFPNFGGIISDAAMMKKILIALVALTTAALITSVYVSILQSPSRNTWLVITFSAYAAMVLLALGDILASKNIKGIEKLLWCFVVLFGNMVGVVVYILIAKKDARRRG